MVCTRSLRLTLEQEKAVREFINRRENNTDYVLFCESDSESYVLLVWIYFIQQTRDMLASTRTRAKNLRRKMG